jgi:hypothetical protein
MVVGMGSAETLRNRNRKLGEIKNLDESKSQLASANLESGGRTVGHDRLCDSW